MKKLIILLILSTFLLSSCGICNLNNFTLPNDSEFLTLVQELDTPEKICQYMQDNFKYEPHISNILTPYELYLIKKGDCDDFSNFAIFIANYHNYETYQIKIFYSDTIYYHVIAVFKENGKYNFSDNQYYFPLEFANFREIVNYDSNYLVFKNWSKYIVYDYWNDVVEQVTK